MSSVFRVTQDTTAPAPVVGRQVYPRLQASVMVVLLAFVAFFLYRHTEEPAAKVIGAIAITVVALIPALIWASGHVGGLPILPAHAATLVLTFAVPLASGHPEIASKDADAIVSASLGSVLYAVVATGFWYAMLRGKIAGRRSYRVLPAIRGYRIFLGTLVMGALFNIMVVGGMLAFDAGLYSVVRATTIALTSIALFVVAVRLGGTGLTPVQKVGALAVILFFIITQLATLYLGSAIISVVSLIVGYVIGSHRIPWPSIVAGVLILGVLHAGKGEMRERYWWGNEAQDLSVGAFPGFMLDWIEAGVDGVTAPPEETNIQPIYERISLMHLLLLAQSQSEAGLAFLDGETYAMIPKVLLPRFIDPEKPSTHDATNLLSQHYRLQSAGDQEGTMIGWGMIVEGYANFGLLGIAGVAMAMGLFLGWVTRLTVMAPFMSLHNFFGILIMVIAVQSELTMVVLITAALQSTFSMLLLWPFCEIERGSGRA